MNGAIGAPNAAISSAISASNVAIQQGSAYAATALQLFVSANNAGSCDLDAGACLWDERHFVMVGRRRGDPARHSEACRILVYCRCWWPPRSLGFPDEFVGWFSQRRA